MPGRFKTAHQLLYAYGRGIRTNSRRLDRAAARPHVDAALHLTEAQDLHLGGVTPLKPLQECGVAVACSLANLGDISLGAGLHALLRAKRKGQFVLW